jgi:leader peptidase (prepilin peptidase)/N-methyltransferase
MPHWQIHAILVVGLFAVGTVVGSFLNVCIYRIPWQKSVVWPASHCPRCWTAIGPADNIPVVSWLALRGQCRNCGLSIAARYPLIEFLVGLLFASVYLSVALSRPIPWGTLPTWLTVGLAYQLSLVALLVAATFIDFDLTIIPDQVTVPGMIVGIVVGTIFPEIRPDPSTAATHWEGFWVGVRGLLVGGGLTLCVRTLGTLALRREAMGFGDVTLMAMIGAYLGWQAAVLTFFIAPFFGLSHALAKVVMYVSKRLTGRKSSSADREIPFGPYLSMSALALMLSWPWFWAGWASERFAILKGLFAPL